MRCEKGVSSPLILITLTASACLSGCRSTELNGATLAAPNAPTANQPINSNDFNANGNIGINGRQGVRTGADH